jgi:amidase
LPQPATRGLSRLGTVALAVLIGGLLALPSGGAAQQTPAPRDCLRMLGDIDLQTATIPQLQAAMAQGRITSADLVRAFEARIAAYDTAGPKLNAVREVNPHALAQADALDAERAAGHIRGQLHGIPIMLKDNIDTVDEPTTAGSIALEGSMPVRDATVVERLRRAGAVILGKLNLSEFAQWISLNNPNGNSSLGGQVLNAYDRSGDPGGSSSGSGVAATMAFASVTLGSETSLSILSPTKESSVVGIKTTVGMVSRAGVLPLAPDFDTVGPLARNVTDAATVLGAIAGPDPRDAKTAGAAGKLPPHSDFAAGLHTDGLKGVRLAYSEADAQTLSGDSVTQWNAALDRLRSLGATLVPIRSLDDQSETPLGLIEIGSIPNEFKASFNQYLATETHPTHGVHTLSDVIAYNSQHPDRVKYGQELLQISDLTPGLTPLGTVQSAPIILAAQAQAQVALAEGQADAIIGPGYAHGRVGAAAGYPTVMVPLYSTDGGFSSIGLSFMGAAYSEAQLLDYAYAYEQASPRHLPPTDASRQLKPASCPVITTAAQRAAVAAKKAKKARKKCKSRARHAAKRRAAPKCSRKPARKRKHR